MTIKTFIIVIFLSLLFADCCNCGNVSKEGVDIPEGLQTKADAFVISKTGKEFFYQYIKPDYEKVTKTVAQER